MLVDIAAFGETIVGIGRVASLIASSHWYMTPAPPARPSDFNMFISVWVFFVFRFRMFIWGFSELRAPPCER